MTPDFMRQKPNATNEATTNSDAKMNRKSLIERSGTMDISALRRNNSFTDSRKFLEPESGQRKPASGWSQTIQEMTARKPPSISPRGSFKRTKDAQQMNGPSDIAEESPSTRKANPLATSSSFSSLRKRDSEQDSKSLSSSLSTSNIRRVQEKSNQFLEQVTSLSKNSPTKQLVASASASNIPKIITSEAFSSSIVPQSSVKSNHRKILEELKATIAKETQKRHFMKLQLVSDLSKASKFSQINDVYVLKTLAFDSNQIHKIRTKSGKEYHVRVKFSDQVSPEAVEIHPVLGKMLEQGTSGGKIELVETKCIINCVENIEMVPLSDVHVQIAKDMEEKFKKYITNNTRISPLVLNQNQIYKIDDYLLTVKLIPSSLSFCVIDSEILRENAVEVVKRGEPNEYAGMMQDEKKKNRKKKEELTNVLKLEKYQKIIEETANGLHPTINKFRVLNIDQTNFIVAGPPLSGKGTICSEIRKNLELRDIKVSIFNCAQYKGRKVESIIRDMRGMLMSCLQAAPAVYIVFNLDSLAAQSHDENHTQETEYLQKLSNSIRYMLEEFTHDYGHHVSILVTVSKLSNLNKVLYRSFGYYLFRSVVRIPNLEADDRRELFKKLFISSADMKIDSLLDWDKYVRITEGYHIGDICQFADRAIFFAIKENCMHPVLTEELMNKSLAISNRLCLEGIKTEVPDDEESYDVNEKIPGMDNVIATLEEVLCWPTKFPKIFENSPLRNQAGILLFGAPGTGKGFIVNQITKRWNLRLISIKGPELLAKYIGQSEENVRNLFEKAKSARPCILFFDEFDSLAPRRGHDSTGVTDRVVNQLLTELDGVKALEGVSIICATSRPDLIDPALLRSGRIDRLVECQLPNAHDRLEILKWLTKSLSIDPSIDLKMIASKLDHFTGADIKSVLTTANMNAIEEELRKNAGKVLDYVLIRIDHLEHAVSNTRPSLTQQDIQRYHSLYDIFKNHKSVTTETPKKVSLA